VSTEWFTWSDSARPNLERELGQRPPKMLPTLGIHIYADFWLLATCHVTFSYVKHYVSYLKFEQFACRWFKCEQCGGSQRKKINLVNTSCATTYFLPLATISPPPNSYLRLCNSFNQPCSYQSSHSLKPNMGCSSSSPLVPNIQLPTPFLTPHAVSTIRTVIQDFQVVSSPHFTIHYASMLQHCGKQWKYPDITVAWNVALPTSHTFERLINSVLLNFSLLFPSI